MNFFITHYYILYTIYYILYIDFYFYMIFAPTETVQNKETQNISHVEENNELDSYNKTHLKEA